MAIAQALLVTLIWSFSWVLIRIGLDDIPPLPFAGLRYFLAPPLLILLPLIFRNGHVDTVRKLDRRDWLWLTLLGVVYYTLNQGWLFVSLDYLTNSVTLSLLLNLSTLAVAFMGVVFLKEYLTLGQWIGVLVFFVGVVRYFHPIDIPADEMKGLFFGILTMPSNIISGSHWAAYQP